MPYPKAARCLVALLTLAPLLGPASVTHAHVGDEIYFFYELLDEDLHRIDLTDASVEDWLDVLGEPSLTAIVMNRWDSYLSFMVDGRPLRRRVAR